MLKTRSLRSRTRSNTWNQVGIKNLLNPPVQSPPPAQPTYGIPSVAPQVSQNMPAQLTTLPTNIQGLKDLIDDCKSYTAAYVAANPGCVYNLFDPSNPQCVNEASAAVASAWEYSMMEMEGNDLVVTFYASNATDQSIASQVTSVVMIDLGTNTINSVLIEG